MLSLLYRNGALKTILRHRWRITAEGITVFRLSVYACVIACSVCEHINSYEPLARISHQIDN